MARVRISHDPRLDVTMTEEHKEHLDNVADSRGISTAALCRMWLAAGERAEQNVVPILTEDAKTTAGTHVDPIEQMFYKHLPSNSEDAIPLEELKQEMKQEIDERVMELFRKVENIELTDGKVYHEK